MTGRSEGAPTPALRRSFAAAYKLGVLERYDQADRDARTEILRAEQLRPSQISQWRRQRDAAALIGMSKEPGGQPAREVHASDGLWQDFGDAAAAAGYRPAQLLRVVMRYYCGRSDLLPPRPERTGKA